MRDDLDHQLRVGVDDVEVEITDAEPGADHRDDRTSTGVADRAEDEPGPEPVDHRGDRVGGGGPGPDEDDDVEPADPSGPQCCQQRPRRGPIDDEDGGSAGAPQPGAGDDLGAGRGGGRAGEDRREQGRGADGEEGAPDEPVPSGEAVDGDDRQAEAGEHDDVGRLEVAERQVGRPSGDGGEPPEQDLTREVEDGGEPGAAADDAGQQPAGESPHHQRAGGGRSEEVGRERREGQPTKGGHEHRRHPDLGGGGDGRGGGEPTRAGQATLDRGSQEDDPGGCSDRQEEAVRPDEEGVDQEDGRRREGQAAQARGLPAEGCGGGGDRGHGGGPHDRRLPPGDQSEQRDDGEDGDEPAAESEARQDRRTDGEHERDVLTGDGEQVREPRGAEVVSGGDVLLAIVADDHPGEQGAAVG